MSIFYLFKNIHSIHSADQMIDVILSKTQRKTPSEVHPNYAIGRIREFYMRKIKFCSEQFQETLKGIVSSFPQLNDIHPFFSDILNILYDKDHYKIALSQINVVGTIIEKICKDYLKLIKYADSLYRCKALKIAAFGRMCTAVKRVGPSLVYLEEIRKHIGRLPSIDPFLPTILFFGYPNVGKSSLINKMTRAKVEVSSMPFSTQNLYVGHTEYKNIQIQCIDSPGILDRPLDQRNTIEMQSLTALAHLKTHILYIIDISETCGYSLENQVKLLNSLKPLLKDQLLTIALNKVDLFPLEELSDQCKQILSTLESENPQASFIQLSCNRDDLIEQAKDKLCQELLNKRLGQKNSNQNKLANDEDYYRGVTVVQPRKVTKERQSFIPQSVLEEKQKEKKETLKDLQEQYGGAGVFSYPLQEHFMLENEEWRYDAIPEIINGKNIFDFVDPEIEKKIMMMEEEQSGLVYPQEELLTEKERQENELLEKVRDAKYVKKMESSLKNNRSLSKGKLNLSNLKERLSKKGIQSDKAVQRLQEHQQKKTLKRLRAKEMNMEIEEPDNIVEKRDLREEMLEKKRRKIQKKVFSKDGRKGESDREVFVSKPKHLFSGKSTVGKRDFR